MIKKNVLLGAMLISASLYAEDYPNVVLAGVNPATGAVAVLETLVTDGRGDIKVDLKILAPQAGLVFAASTTEAWDESDAGASEQWSLALESERLLKSNSDKLKKHGIELSQKAQVLYEHLRDTDNDQGGLNYNYATQLELGAEKSIKLSIIKHEPEGEFDWTSWNFRYSNSSIPGKEPVDVYIHSVAKEADEDGVPANVGFQKVLLVKSEQGDRLLVLTSYQTQGFEGPDTNFVYSLIDVK